MEHFIKLTFLVVRRDEAQVTESRHKKTRLSIQQQEIVSVSEDTQTGENA